MTVDQVLMCAVLAMDIVIGLAIIKSYGELKYNKGRLAGFNECSKLTIEALSKGKDLNEVVPPQRDGGSKSTESKEA